MHITAKGLGRRFAKQDALHGLDFECQPGEIIALLGNNGAGKTTLLHLLAGLLVPTGGVIEVDGEVLSRRDEDLRKRIAIIPDFSPFFPGHSVFRHIAMVCALHQIPEEGLENKILTLMEEIGILALGNSPLLSLSRGETYKAILVGTLITRAFDSRKLDLVRTPAKS